MNNAVENVKSIGAELIASGQTEKARAFATTLLEKVLAKGGAWINTNSGALHAYSSADKAYFSVAANRLFFIGKWQVALLK